MYPYNFFKRYLKHGDGSKVCRMAGVSDTQLHLWKTNQSLPRVDKIKDFLKALAVYKNLSYEKLLIEYFRTI